MLVITRGYFPGNSPRPQQKGIFFVEMDYPRYDPRYWMLVRPLVVLAYLLSKIMFLFFFIEYIIYLQLWPRLSVKIAYSNGTIHKP